MIVSENALNKVYSSVDESTLKKARSYVSTGKVKVYRIKYIDSNNFVINARVLGHGRIYEVEVNMQNGVISSYKCECQPAYMGICPHVVSAVIEFATNEKYNRQLLIGITHPKIDSTANTVSNNKYSMSYKVIDEFKNINETVKDIVHDDIQDGSVRIVPRLKYNKRYDEKISVSFQIGMKQLYKIKDLPNFLHCMNYGVRYRYGSKFEFIHNINKFDEESKKIVPFILKYAAIIKYANENINGYNISLGYPRNLSTSEIKLNEDTFDELFDLLAGTQIMFDAGNKSGEYTFTPEEPHITFDMQKIDNTDYKLVNNFNNEYSVINGRKYTYVVVDNKIYRCSKFFEKNTIKLLEIFKNQENKPILFNKDDLPTFFSVVVPKVKKHIDTKNMPDEDIKQFVPKELKVKLFFNFDSHGDLVCDVKFCYDDYEFNPFDENAKIDVIRNIAKEDEVKLNFANSGFSLDKKNHNMVINNNDSIYNFLENDMPKFTDKYEVLVTDDFKTKQVRGPKFGTLGVRVENNLLHIDFDNLDFDKSELKDIMKNYNIKKKYHRLKDGSFLKLENNEDIEFIHSVMDGMDVDYKSLNEGNTQVPIYRSMYLDKLLNNVKNTNITKNDEYKKVISKVEDKSEKENQEIQIPETLDNVLRSYQKVGFRWLKVLDEYGFGGILADDMGLGKTLQVIAVITSYISNVKQEDKKPSLVVCPSSLTINWKNEIKKFKPDIKVLVIYGSAEERRNLISKINGYDLVISSYDLLRRDIDIYNEFKYVFKYVIADEAQYVKNSKTQNATSLKKINALTRFALTGTPIENSLSELWSIFDYIMPGYLFSYSKFKKNYEVPIIKENNENALKRVKMLIEPFILRRLKKDVLTELPEKTVTVMYNEMQEEQNKIYLSYLVSSKRELQQEINVSGFEKSQIKILALLTRLRQICCDPSLFIDNYKGESSKLNQCMEIIEDAIEGDHKILLFSQFTSMLAIIERELAKRKVKYFRLVGSTKVNERIESVNEFNKNNEIKVFLISLKAGGTGLNLTGADVVIHYDPWWNLSAENQATDRAHRIGQENNVQVYKLITENSIEEKIHELQEKKSELTEDILSTEQTFINKLSKEDIMSLFE